MLPKHVEDDQTSTVRPVLVDRKEEHEIDFRVPGLSHSVVKEAEHLRVQEFVKRIENHPHREALHADLQQNNVYNPFSKDSKAMILGLGNVEFFELCEAVPKLQCSHCLLHWIQGIVYCTCGQCLIDSESRRQFNTGCQPWCSTRQDRGKKRVPYSLECVEEMLYVRKSTLKVNILQVFTIDFSEIQFFVNHKSQSDGQNKSAKSGMYLQKKTIHIISLQRKGKDTKDNVILL